MIVGGDRKSVERFLDKGETLRASDAAGFPTPEWRTPTTIEGVLGAVDEIGYPCALKPRRTYARVGPRFIQRRYIVVRDRTEARVAIERIALDGAMPIVQAYVPGRSLAITAVVSRGKVVAGVAREAMTFFPITGGASCWRRTVPPDDIGVSEAFALLEKVNYDGLGEVEYQVDNDGIPRLMEIGVRAHGWVSLAVAAGVDLPVLAARMALGEESASLGPVSWRVGVEMRSPGGESQRLLQALDPRKPMPVMFSRRSVIRKLWPPWRPGMRYDNVDLGDLGPWVPAGLRGKREQET